jgi:beta-aspartyl-peptidase (threonine type)
MYRTWIFGCWMLFSSIVFSYAQEKEYVVLVHGGAGAMNALKEQPEKENQYYASLDTALMIGDSILSAGGRGIDAVIAVISYFEDNPLFNAGVGATLSAKGTFELDASVMEGKDLSAGAVAGVTHIKNPIKVARMVKDCSPHVFLTGDGAEEFAVSQGAEMVDDNLYFSTPKSRQWIEELKKASAKNGTVGCVVLDKDGNLAAGTSTGGMFKKRWGRIGDSPVIGAGTYADNASCAVSCTGHGEYFIRHAVAFNLCARVKYLKETVEEAGNYIIHTELSPEAGSGGLIAIDKSGNFAMPFNTEGMFRGYLYKKKNAPELVKRVGIRKEMRSL